MAKIKVLIVGASVAGPMAAYWFARTGLADVTVIERFSSLRTAGQNIDIRTAGVTVMRRTPGMEAAVRSKTTKMDGMSWVRPDGSSYGTLRATGNPDQQSLISEYEIFRGDLARILVDLTEEGKGKFDNVKYVYDEQIKSISQKKSRTKGFEQSEKFIEASDDDDAANIDDGPVTVEFTNGHLPTGDYDLVVACDGATSRTRALGLKCGYRDHIHPTNCWGAYFSIPQDLLKGDTVAQAHSAVGGRFIAVGPDPFQPGTNRVGLMCLNPISDKEAIVPFREALKTIDSDNGVKMKQFVAKKYDGMQWKTKEIMADMLETDDFYASEVVQVKMPSMSAMGGHFALVGDAGYAPGFTGGGTTLAMAGGYILAGEVMNSLKAGKDLTEGLRRYEEVMKPIVTEMQKVPPLVPTIMAPQTWWGIWLRNHIWGLVIWTGIIEFAQKYLAGAFASTSEFPLPNYEWGIEDPRGIVDAVAGESATAAPK